MTLREAREKAGLTLSEASKKSGYGRNTICRWESGNPPRIDKLMDICQTYSISILDLNLSEWR